MLLPPVTSLDSDFGQRSRDSAPSYAPNDREMWLGGQWTDWSSEEQEPQLGRWSVESFFGIDRVIGYNRAGQEVPGNRTGYLVDIYA